MGNLDFHSNASSMSANIATKASKHPAPGLPLYEIMVLEDARNLVVVALADRRKIMDTVSAI